VRGPPTAADRAAIVLALTFPTAVTWLYFVALHGAASWQQQAAAVAGKTIQFVFPLVWVCLVQRQRLQNRWPTRSGLLVGALFGIAVSAALAVLYFAILKPSAAFDHPAQAIRAKIVAMGVSSPAAYFALGCFYAAIHSLLEEYYWRWFVFGQLVRVCPGPLAITVSSVGFGAHHLLVLAQFFTFAWPWPWVGTLGVMIGGAAWAWLFQREGTLYSCWLSHAIVDAAIFAIGFDLLA
jgi:CAAX protease family protein